MLRNLLRSVSVLLVLLSALFLVSCTNNPDDGSDGGKGGAVELPVYTVDDDNISSYDFSSETEEFTVIAYCTDLSALGDKLRASKVSVNLVINASVTEINAWAFYRCKLISVKLPDSVTSIGDSAFYCCDIESMTIPNSVTSIGFGAFCNCDSLTSVTIPDSVTSIEYTAFADCEKLESIMIPFSVTRIGGRAFYNCSGLKVLIIPNSVTDIDGMAFYGNNTMFVAYYGTKEQWEFISKSEGIFSNGTRITCSDGTVTYSGIL